MQNSVSFDPDVDDGLDVLLSVAWTYGYDSVEEALRAGGLLEDNDSSDPDDKSGTRYPLNWTLAKMRRYVERLAPNAVKGSEYIAAQTLAGDDHIESSEVAEYIGCERSSLAPIMRSCGTSAKKIKGVGAVPPWKRQSVPGGSLYTQHPELARLFLDVCREQGVI